MNKTLEQRLSLQVKNIITIFESNTISNETKKNVIEGTRNYLNQLIDELIDDITT